MNYSELIHFLYKEDAPRHIELHIPNIKLEKSPEVYPSEDGIYLIYHSIYGWCLYGFTVKHKWGGDDEYIDAKSRIHYKVSYWTDLKFLEDYSEKFSRNV